MKRIWKSNFLIKLRSWEYWPFQIVYFPIFIYWLLLSIKARSLLFFTASNPGIENGGMLGESKIKILKNIPKEFIPKTIFCPNNATFVSILRLMEDAKIKFPVICKPDVGERGWKVEKIEDIDQFKAYLTEIKVSFLIQEYIDFPIELGVFYFRYPSKPKGKISSIVVKEMLSVSGNGRSSLQQLILNHDRAKLQWPVLREKYHSQLNEVIENGKVIELISIGNHCKGTKFLDASHLINYKLEATFDNIAATIPGFYYGRFDLRVKNHEDLYSGKIKIMELNGSGSEPSHIYHPGFSIWKAYNVLFYHWKVLYKISKENNKDGIPYLTFSQGWRKYKALLKK